MKLPLFDVDGTLLQGGHGNPAHRDGFDAAFREVFGLPDASINEIVTDGKIDKQIVLEVLQLHDLKTEKIISRLDEAVAHITQYYLENKSSGRNVVAAGVIELLDALQARHLPLGLLTGNIETIAYDKLSQAGIRQYFQFGGFGNLALRRVDLIEVARQRAMERLQLELQPTDFFIIGDSPLDVACAQAGGIPVIAVASANYTFEQLSQSNPDLVVHSLEELKTVLQFINDLQSQ